MTYSREEYQGMMQARAAHIRQNLAHERTQIRHTQSLAVADYVTKNGKSLADAVLIVLGGISDGSGPRTSEVADEAMAIIASRTQGQG